MHNAVRLFLVIVYIFMYLCFFETFLWCVTALQYFKVKHQAQHSVIFSFDLNFPPKTVHNLIKFSAHDSNLEYLFWRSKNSPVSSDLKPPLGDVNFHFWPVVKVVHTLVWMCSQKFKPWKLSKVHLFFFDFHWLTSDLDADASLASSSCTMFDLTNFLFVLIKVFHIKGGFRSEDAGEFFLLQNKYSEVLSWAENLNKLFTV